MPNGSGIKKETFLEADEHTQRALTFDLLSEIYKNQCVQLEACDNRFKSIEKKRKFDTVLAGSSGLFGGFVAMIVKFKVWG